MDETTLERIIEEQLVDFKDVVETLEADIPREAPSKSDMDRMMTFFINANDKIQEKVGDSAIGDMIKL